MVNYIYDQWFMRSSQRSTERARLDRIFWKHNHKLGLFCCAICTPPPTLQCCKSTQYLFVVFTIIYHLRQIVSAIRHPMKERLNGCLSCSLPPSSSSQHRRLVYHTLTPIVGEQSTNGYMDHGTVLCNQPPLVRFNRAGHNFHSSRDTRFLCVTIANYFLKSPP